MIKNLFSLFDPISLSPYLSLNWISLMIIFFLPNSIWLIKSKLLFNFWKMLNFLLKELNLVLSKISSSEKLILLSFFILILFNNFAGLFPYVFTASSHLSITLSLSLPLWVGYMILNIFNNFSLTMANLIPKGSPKFLAPFMVLIEIISNFMRPLTLSIRLVANLVAGHLILSLISLPMVYSSFFLKFILMFFVLIMTILELGVAMIQSFVFMILFSLYLNEVNKFNNKL